MVYLGLVFAAAGLGYMCGSGSGREEGATNLMTSWHLLGPNMEGSTTNTDGLVTWSANYLFIGEWNRQFYITGSGSKVNSYGNRDFHFKYNEDGKLLVNRNGEAGDWYDCEEISKFCCRSPDFYNAFFILK